MAVRHGSTNARGLSSQVGSPSLLTETCMSYINLKLCTLSPGRSNKDPPGALVQNGEQILPCEDYARRRASMVTALEAVDPSAGSSGKQLENLK